MIIIMGIMVILMIMLTKITEKYTNMLNIVLQSFRFFLTNIQHWSCPHLSQLLDADFSISITVKQGKGLLQAVDVAGGDLPVRADPEGGGPGHNSSSAGGKPSTGQVGASGAADQPLLAAFHSSCDRPCNAPSQLNSTHGGYLYLYLYLELTSFQLHI